MRREHRKKNFLFSRRQVSQVGKWNHAYAHDIVLSRLPLWLRCPEFAAVCTCYQRVLVFHWAAFFCEQNIFRFPQTLRCLGEELAINHRQDNRRCFVPCDAFDEKI